MAERLRVSWKWKPVKSKCFGDIAKPVARVFLLSEAGTWIEFRARVNSGAVISLFNKSECEILGLELEKGQPCQLKGAAGNHPLDTFVHPVKMSIGGDTFNTRVAFAIDDEHEQLLGRLDVFESWEVDLRGKLPYTSLTREN